MNDKFTLNDFMSFDKMIAPSFLSALYYLHIIICILFSFWLISQGLGNNYGSGKLLLGGLVNLVFGPFLIRLLYEFVIVIFKIHSRLVNIDVNTMVNRPVINTPESVVYENKITPPITTQPTPKATVVQPESSESKAPNVVQDYWNSGNGEPQFTKPDFSSVNLGNLNLGNGGINLPNFTAGNAQGVDLQGITQKFPNWKLAVSSFIVFVGIVSSYASVMGVSFSIKDSAFGIFAMLAAMGMIAISALSMKMQWYIVSFAVTLVGTLLSFLDDKSLFGASRKVNSVADSIGGLFPQGNNYFEQVRQNAPSVYSYLSVSFYLMVIAMIYCGYCIVNGQYKERVSPTQ